MKLTIDGIEVTVVRKRIRSLNLYVKPPDGRVEASAPMRLSEKQIIDFLSAHKDWILRQQADVREKHPVRLYQTGEPVSVFGVPHTLRLREAKTRRSCQVYLEQDTLVMAALSDSTAEERKSLLEQWQRMQLHDVAGILLRSWAPRLGVEVKEWHIKRMRTKWGTCNYRAHRIWLSLGLAEQPLECVEYVVVHELMHLHVPNHGEAFQRLMTQYMPDWRERKKRLNSR